MYLSRVRNKVFFTVPTTKAGIVVIKISNIYEHPMFYSVQVSSKGMREMKTKTPIYGQVDFFLPEYYRMPVRKQGY